MSLPVCTSMCITLSFPLCTSMGITPSVNSSMVTHLFVPIWDHPYPFQCGYGPVCTSIDITPVASSMYHPCHFQCGYHPCLNQYGCHSLSLPVWVSPLSLPFCTSMGITLSLPLCTSMGITRVSSILNQYDYYPCFFHSVPLWVSPLNLRIWIPTLSVIVWMSKLTLPVWIPAGSPSRGGDVTVFVFDINQPSLPTPFYSVLVCISVLWSFQLYFIS